MKQMGIVLMMMFAALQTAQAAVKGETVEYKSGTTVLKGYIAYDDAVKGKRPGILVVHEWWGQNEYARSRARMLAGLGYTALALDMYGDGHEAHHPDDAGKFSSEVRKNLGLAKQRFDAALTVLKKHRTVDSNRIGAIGYCFGGAIALEMARQGENLKGVASFHGNLNTEHPAQQDMIKARLLVMTGADDPFVPPAQVEAFRKEMDAARVDYRVIAYPGAKHAFTNPGATELGEKFNLPLAYNADADRQSWAAMQAFFQDIFATK